MACIINKLICNPPTRKQSSPDFPECYINVEAVSKSWNESKLSEPTFPVLNAITMSQVPLVHFWSRNMTRDWNDQVCYSRTYCNHVNIISICLYWPNTYKFSSLQKCVSQCLKYITWLLPYLAAGVLFCWGLDDLLMPAAAALGWTGGGWVAGDGDDDWLTDRDDSRALFSVWRV